MRPPKDEYRTVPWGPAKFRCRRKEKECSSFRIGEDHLIEAGRDHQRALPRNQAQ